LGWALCLNQFQSALLQARSCADRAENRYLVIEVADSSLSRDRGIKLRSYARAGIACYWIINLLERCVEVYTRPINQTPEPSYLDKQMITESESVALSIGDPELGHIPVRDLLP